MTNFYGLLKGLKTFVPINNQFLLFTFLLRMYKDIGTRSKINTSIINHKQILAYFMIELLKIKHFLEPMGFIGFFGSPGLNWWKLMKALEEFLENRGQR